MQIDGHIWNGVLHSMSFSNLLVTCYLLICGSGVEQWNSKCNHGVFKFEEQAAVLLIIEIYKVWLVMT